MRISEKFQIWEERSSQLEMLRGSLIMFSSIEKQLRNYFVAHNECAQLVSNCTSVAWQLEAFSLNPKTLWDEKKILQAQGRILDFFFRHSQT